MKINRIKRLPGIIASLLLILSSLYSIVPLSASANGETGSKISSLLSLHIQIKDQQQNLTGQGGAQLFGIDAPQGIETSPVNSERVYLHFAQEPTATQLDELITLGVTVYPDTWLPPVNGFKTGFVLADMPVSRLDDLAAKDYIISMDTAEQKLLNQNDQSRVAMNVAPVWSSGYTGAGVTVAVIDSGLDTANPDFPTPLSAIDYSAYPSTDSTINNTVTGHGTHVTGSLLGRGVNGPLYKGVAPGASLVFIKVGDDSNAAVTSDALTYAIRDAAAVYHAKIINVSIGAWSQYHDGTDQWCQAVEYATSLGATVFVAAGNYASANWHYSGTVNNFATTMDIPITISPGNTSYLGINLVWYDGTDRDNLSLQYFDINHNLLSPAAGGQSESPRGTQASQYYFNNQRSSGTYYLRVTNNTNSSRFFHLYYTGGSNAVTFSNSDPAYTIASPAEADNAIAVGAYITRTNWTNYQGILESYVQPGVLASVAAYSSRGPRVDAGAPAKPNILAPGGAIISVRDPLYTPGNANLDPGIIDNDGLNLNGSGPANYFVMQGTSIATPMASGVGALILSRHPGLSPPELKHILESTATDKGVPGFDNITGYGLINAALAANYSVSPTVTTNFASAITSAGATLNGTVNTIGTAASVALSFEYGPTLAYGTVVSATPSTLSIPGLFHSALSGLTSGQTYHYRAIADAGTGGLIYGEDVTFLAADPFTGGKIVFTSERDGDAEIYTMNGNGANQTRLTNSPGYDYQPAWSPDGTKIAFVSKRNGPSNIYVMDADGGNPVRLTTSSGDWFPAWSPDGTKIIFESSQADSTQVFVMDSSGGNQVQLTYSGANWQPDWSSAGKIAFSSDIPSGTSINVMNPDGSSQTTLINNNSYNEDVQWSPDATKIAFTSHATGIDQIYLASSTGLNVTRITATDTYSIFPAWSPDGSQIVFSSARDGLSQIYVMNTDGSNVRRLTNQTAGHDYDPDWTVQSAITPAQLAFTTPARTVSAGAVSSVLTVQARNSSGAPLTMNVNTDLNLTSSSPSARFDISATGPFDGSITKVTIPDGANQVSFYYRDTLAGAPTLTASGPGAVSITQQVTVNPGIATQIRVESAANGSGTIMPLQHLNPGQSITVYSVTRDQYGNFLANLNGTWSLTNKAGSISNSDLVPALNGRSAVFTAHLIGRATIHVASGTFTSVDSAMVTVTAGDANGDGIINMADVTTVERMILGYDPTTAGADANLDGLVNMGDVTVIERFILGLG